jgi:hypothetical protein
MLPQSWCCTQNPQQQQMQQTQQLTAQKQQQQRVPQVAARHRGLEAVLGPPAAAAAGLGVCVGVWMVVQLL